MGDPRHPAIRHSPRLNAVRKFTSLAARGHRSRALPFLEHQAGAERHPGRPSTPAYMQSGAMATNHVKHTSMLPSPQPKPPPPPRPGATVLLLRRATQHRTRPSTGFLRATKRCGGRASEVPENEGHWSGPTTANHTRCTSNPCRGLCVFTLVLLRRRFRFLCTRVRPKRRGSVESVHLR
jgi:hypothetical protein